MILDVLQAYGLLPFYVDPYVQTWIKILCPLHNEKTPSLSINVHTGAFKCFGCDAHGQSELDFILQLEKVHGYPNVSGNFIEWRALVYAQKLSHKREIVQHPFIVDPYASLSSDAKIEMSKAFFDSLSYVDWNDDEMKKNYLLDVRHMSPRVLIQEDVRLNHTSQYPIVIPVIEQGEFVGYTMRRVSDGEPKYLHSEGFRKTEHYYGTLRKGSVILVEGPLDKWRFQEFGETNVVCTFGWSCSLKQLEKILEYATEIVVAYDNDKSGKRGYENVKHMVRAVTDRMPVLRFQFPQHRKDPCDLQKRECILPCYVW